MPQCSDEEDLTATFAPTAQQNGQLRPHPHSPKVLLNPCDIASCDFISLKFSRNVPHALKCATNVIVIVAAQLCGFCNAQICKVVANLAKLWLSEMQAFDAHKHLKEQVFGPDKFMKISLGFDSFS